MVFGVFRVSLHPRLRSVFPLTRLTGRVWPRGHARPKPPSSLTRQTGSHTDVKDTKCPLQFNTGSDGFNGLNGFEAGGAESGQRLVRFSSVGFLRSEEHTSELQSLRHLVCRL